MKIAIAGAGIGGLYAAYLFGSKGHAVTVYERTKDLNSMRYDWHDDVDPKVFERLGLKIPEGSYPKKDWTFISPCGNVQGMTQAADETDYTIERRPLNAYLYGLAAEYAEVIFGRTVTGARVENGKVTGIRLDDGSVEESDLVIDCCGVDSVVRKSLPETFGIDREVGADCTFLAYRAYYDAVPGAEVKYTNKVYLKHLGEAGISWCIVDNDPTKVDVLIGRLGELTKECNNNALEALRKDNPVLGTELQRAGIVCKIPVRRPLDVFVADGYAAIGDSACMTIPLIGSGIASSLNAAKFLFEAVGECNDAPVEKLWKYETKVYEAFGAQHCGVDYMKQWILSTRNEDVDMILGKKILSNSDLQKISVGKMVKLGLKDVVEKVKAAGVGKIPKLLPMASMMSKAQKVSKIAAQIPAEYDEKAIAVWANKLDGFFG